MTGSQLRELHELNAQGDILLLQKLLEYCNSEDKREVEQLLYLNDTVGIGWGEPSSPEYAEEFKQREDEYYRRRDYLLMRYDTPASWQDD